MKCSPGYSLLTGSSWVVNSYQRESSPHLWKSWCTCGRMSKNITHSCWWFKYIGIIGRVKIPGVHFTNCVWFANGILLKITFDGYQFSWVHRLISWQFWECKLVCVSDIGGEWKRDRNVAINLKHTRKHGVVITNGTFLGKCPIAPVDVSFSGSETRIPSSGDETITYIFIRRSTTFHQFSVVKNTTGTNNLGELVLNLRACDMR